MVLEERMNGLKAAHREYGFGATVHTDVFDYRQKSVTESQPEPLHTTKNVRIAIRNELQFIKELEAEAECLEIKLRSRTREERAEEPSKRLKREVESELFQLSREIRLRKFSLKVARAAFTQFMLAGDDDGDGDATMDLSDVVHLAREPCLDETDAEVSEAHLQEMVESRLEMLGLYVIRADNWNFQLGFLMNQEIEV